MKKYSLAGIALLAFFALAPITNAATYTFATTDGGGYYYGGLALGTIPNQTYYYSCDIDYSTSTIVNVYDGSGWHTSAGTIDNLGSGVYSFAPSMAFNGFTFHDDTHGLYCFGSNTIVFDDTYSTSTVVKPSGLIDFSQLNFVTTKQDETLTPNGSGNLTLTSVSVTQSYNPAVALLCISLLIAAFFAVLGLIIWKIRKMGK